MKKIFILGLGLLVLPLFNVQAATTIKTLNGLSTTDQLFANDTNVTISSSGSTHTLGWAGILQPSRGGTGTSTPMTQGSILFAGTSGAYSQDNSNFFWDNTNDRLGIGTNTPTQSLQIANGSIMVGNDSAGLLIAPTPGEDIVQANGDGQALLLSASSGVAESGGRVYITSGASTTSGGGDILIGTSGSEAVNGGGGNISVHAADGSGTASGGSIDIQAGSGSDNSSVGSGGHITIAGGMGASTGYVMLTGGSATSGTPASIVVNGAANPGINIDLGGGNFYLNGFNYVFQNVSGTISLLESSQTFGGINTFSSQVNNFISNTNSTVHIGADGIPGCIVMGDSDGSGVTYVTASNGVLSASTVQPSNCQ